MNSWDIISPEQVLLGLLSVCCEDLHEYKVDEIWHTTSFVQWGKVEI